LSVVAAGDLCSSRARTDARSESPVLSGSSGTTRESRSAPHRQRSSAPPDAKRVSSALSGTRSLLIRCLLWGSSFDGQDPAPITTRRIAPHSSRLAIKTVASTAPPGFSCRQVSEPRPCGHGTPRRPHARRPSSRKPTAAGDASAAHQRSHPRSTRQASGRRHRRARARVNRSSACPRATTREFRTRAFSTPVVIDRRDRCAANADIAPRRPTRLRPGGLIDGPSDVTR